MNLRTSETSEQIRVVQTTEDVPLVSNYPRSGFTSRNGNHEHSVFREALLMIGKHPFLFVGYGIFAVLIAYFFSGTQSIFRSAPTAFAAQSTLFLMSFVASAIGRLFHYEMAYTALTFDNPKHPLSGAIIKSPQAWGAIFVLTFVTISIGLGSIVAASALAGALGLAPFHQPSLMNLISIPVIALATGRFIFAPFIAATRGTSVIGAFRESAVLTHGVAFKALGWTLLMGISNTVASWLTRFDSSVVGHIGFVMPLFLYVVLGVWYLRQIKTSARTK